MNIKLKIIPEIYVNENKECLFVKWVIKYENPINVPSKVINFINKNYTDILNSLNIKEKIYLQEFIIDKINNIHWIGIIHQDAIFRNWIIKNNSDNKIEIDFNKIKSSYYYLDLNYDESEEINFYSFSPNNIYINDSENKRYLSKEECSIIFNNLKTK